MARHGKLPEADFKEMNDFQELEQAYQGTTPPEGVRMLLAIARGSDLMGPGEGWFGPAQSRYSWEWLAERHGVSITDAISPERFLGTPTWFRGLDRDRDGRITERDLDWSDNSFARFAYLVNRLFRSIKTRGDGRLTRDEWLTFFDLAADGKDYLSPDDLCGALLANGAHPGTGPSKDVLLRGLFSGELGSFNEGPQVGAPAPDFSLRTYDGRQRIRLTDVIGEKPVVLVFGNYTCGPFRSMYVSVEEVYARFHVDAQFLAIHVREAHPIEGWQAELDDRVGVRTRQPTTYEERVGVAAQCHQLLKPSMPWLVDEINDIVGHAYSGMPARMYVIDREGRVAYKSGRGPFGFKTAEMEQALIMTLLDQVAPQSPRTAAEEVPEDQEKRANDK